MANFTYVPRIVNKNTPNFNIKSTVMESYKKEYDKLSSDVLYIYELKFVGISSTIRDNIYEHWFSGEGPMNAFWWTSVPSYIWSGQLNVRYLEGSAGYTEQPMRDANGQIYDVTVRFRRQF